MKDEHDTEGLGANWRLLEQGPDGVVGSPDYDPSQWEQDRDYAERKVVQTDSALMGGKYLYTPLVDHIEVEYMPGDSIADIGCAGGHFCRTLRVVLPGSDPVGVDITESYLNVARATYGLPVVRADIRNLPFADASVDHLTCMFVLVHLDQEGLKKAVGELLRVAKKNVFLAGYFSHVRFAGRQGRYIYDVVDLHEIAKRSEGWGMRLLTGPGCVRPMERRVVVEMTDRTLKEGTVRANVWSYVWLRRKEC